MLTYLPAALALWLAFNLLIVLWVESTSPTSDDGYSSRERSDHRCSTDPERGVEWSRSSAWSASMSRPQRGQLWFIAATRRALRWHWWSWP